jgi:hypothetical protein
MIPVLAWYIANGIDIKKLWLSSDILKAQVNPDYQDMFSVYLYYLQNI